MSPHHRQQPQHREKGGGVSKRRPTAFPGAAALLFLAALLAGLTPMAAQAAPEATPAKTVKLDFRDTELTVVVDTIAELTQKNFIYDDSLRGKRVTIISPDPVTLDQAYAIFESMLQVKNFTTVEGPGGVIKIIPISVARQSNISTEQGRQDSRNRDRFITRLIPLKYIDAGEITKTLSTLVSKNAAMVAYSPTNTIILTDSEANIRRILAIIDAIDVETYLAQLRVIKIKHADAAILGDQLAEIFGGDASTSRSGRPSTPRARSSRRTPVPPTATSFGERGKVRIITDERSNSLIIMASRTQLMEIRKLIDRLDVPVTGGGRIQVVYLRNADAEELAETLNALLSGQSSGGAAPARRGGAAVNPQALKSAVTELAEGVTITADTATNSLVIQASKEAFATLSDVIKQLDIRRPQVLVEALVAEVDINEGVALGIDWVVSQTSGNTSKAAGSLTGAQTLKAENPDTPGDGDIVGALLSNSNFFASVVYDNDDGSVIKGIITASETNSGINILSSPHILTSDNEEAEIKIGQNIPIVTGRTDAATGSTLSGNRVTVERQDIGITLRVTPQISEGDSLRMDIFQELTAINTNADQAALVGTPEDVGVSLLKRSVENTVVVADGETVVIGGLLDEQTERGVKKVPFLGDIPFLGWLFKSTTTSVRKTNLLIFLTPRIIRSAEDMEMETIRKREEFRYFSTPDAEVDRRIHEELGIDLPDRSKPPVRRTLDQLDKRYPLERMRELEQGKREARDARLTEREQAATRYAVLAAVYQDDGLASERLTQLIDAGYDGTLVAEESGGSVLYRVIIGPYTDLHEAETISSAIREAFSLSPTVILERSEP